MQVSTVKNKKFEFIKTCLHGNFRGTKAHSSLKFNESWGIGNKSRLQKHTYEGGMRGKREKYYQQP